MLEQTKTSLKPIHGVYELIVKPFKDSSLKSHSFADKVALSAQNLVNAGAKEIAGAKGAYMYPVIGIFRLFGIPNLRSIIAGSLVTGVLVSVIVTIAMFVLAWAPQFAVLSLVITPILAFPAAIFLVLSESWFISFTIAKLTWLEGLQEHVFDEIVQAEAKKDNKGGSSAAAVVSNNNNNKGAIPQEMITAVHNNPKKHTAFSIGKVIGKLRNYPRTVLDDVAEYVVTLPLNLIPGLGSALFLYVNAETQATRYHARYYELRGWKSNPAMIKKFVVENEPAYRAFGIVAMVFNLVPVVNVFFALTNTVGAAVWACDIERSRAAVGGGGGGDATPAAGHQTKKTF